MPITYNPVTTQIHINGNIHNKNLINLNAAPSFPLYFYHWWKRLWWSSALSCTYWKSVTELKYTLAIYKVPDNLCMSYIGSVALLK